ncbi:hypothetical protein [Salisaeta longa]|uniref:hypothetical protein n=1 Tax=Salisaeta longa TaxID=503170 RepID=UPI0003B78802|nr:hypothetical protein [Salisaeta longa]
MNLLDNPIFTVETSTGHEMCSLPRIYALLQADAVESFAKLQAHQKQAWHCFLAQLGAIATENRDLPETEAGWREALAALTVPEAWNLYTEDLSKPAFMQPPVPEGRLDGWKEIHPTEYDVPVLSKSHALKMRRVHTPTDEHWIYLLVNVQTTGFYSPGGRRTVRMNGSYGSRPFFGLTPSLRLGPWIMHDIKVLNTHVDRIEEKYSFKREIHPLLWTRSWSGNGSLDLARLHPLFIDCPRRIRKGEAWMKKSTEAERVIGDINGQTGDPWAPVNISEDKVLNPSRRDFEYRRLRDIIFGDTYERPISFAEATKGYIVCRAVTGEQGGRVNDLQRIIPFSNRRRGWNKIERESKRRVQKAETAESIFSHALGWLFCEDVDEGTSSGFIGAYRKKDYNEPDKAYERQISALHARIDQRFFDRLFEAPDMSDEERQTFWETILVDVLQTQMNEAMTLCPNKQPWKRKAHAQSVFSGRMRHEFTYAKQYDTSYGTESNANDRNADKSHHAAV